MREWAEQLVAQARAEGLALTARKRPVTRRVTHGTATVPRALEAVRFRMAWFVEHEVVCARHFDH